MLGTNYNIINPNAPAVEPETTFNKYIKPCKEKMIEQCCIYAVPILYVIWVAIVISGIIFLVLLGFYVISFLAMSIIVMLGTTLEISGKYVFGNKIYSEYFEVCKNTTYNGNSCFTETKTYCY